MIRKYTKILFFGMGIIAVAHQAQAVKVDIEIDINTTTEYHDCQGYADNIVSFCRLGSEHPEDWPYIKRQIKDFKKLLKKCEKRNGKRKHSSKVKIRREPRFK